MNFNKFLQSKKAVSIAIIIGIIGIILIFLSDYIGKAESNEYHNNINDSNLDEAYCNKLEEDAESIIKNIIGDDNVKVVVTLESGTEYIYAADTNTDIDTKENVQNNNISNNEISDKTQESYIIINTSNGEQPLLISALAPKVRGVAVVCAGGENANVATAIKEAISTLFDISEKNISVIGALK